ncbi:lantibiotic dehydratase [Streptomyces chrestomyceticus]|uniref:lantibiotic dehydratase n=1 Tax=Streptomyces chrestomyceticus TaxID=68185 RepID=UPI003673EAA1
MYRAVDAALIRASARPLAAKLPPWPYLDGRTADDVEHHRQWIGQIWADDVTAAAIELASPHLAGAVHNVLGGHVHQLRTVRRVVVSLVRYLLRMQYRATPFGLFAGPTPVRLGHTAQVRWGTEHRVVAEADAVWLCEVITGLEEDADLLLRLPVVADPTCVIRGTKVVVPHQPSKSGPAEVTMRRTPAVEAVLDLTRCPITVENIVAKLRADYPSTSRSAIEGMVHRLVAHRILLTSLRAPMTTGDALGHLLTQLDAVEADTVPGVAHTAERLRQIHQLLIRHGAAPASKQRAMRTEATRQMTAATSTVDRPLTVNLSPDCDIILPTAVAEEAERALKVIARISPYPSGPPVWQDYRARFLERYSMGALVPVRDLTDPDVGLGFPAGYRGSVLRRPASATTRRDEELLSLAQDAAVNQAREIVLSEANLAALAVGDVAQVPAHVELCFSVLAHSLGAMQQGRFTLSIAGLSLAAGTTAGRFLAMLEQTDRDRMTAAYATMPTLITGAARAQVSSPPLRLRTQNVSRAPALTPHLISLGEHNAEATLDLDYLAVGADSQRLYLASLSTGTLIEPSVMNAVELTNATHPLVRFVTEVHRSHAAVLAPFTWGAAARLPFLPEVRVGRTLLSPASWRLRRRDVGGEDGDGWLRRFTDWRCRYGVVRAVFVGTDDQRLRLDLDNPAHLEMLRIELERTSTVALHEAPGEDSLGWLGRTHEITIPFASELPPADLNTRTSVVVRRNTGRLPGTSPWVYLKVYSHPDRAPEILTTHLPALFQEWEGGTPLWWFTRYSDPESHLRIRLRLPGLHVFGDAAQHVGAWAAALRNDGLVSRIQWDTDEPEIGRYGTGRLLDTAEHFFTADTAAATAQIALGTPPLLRPALTAASFIDIAATVVGSPTVGHRWLSKHLLKAEGAAPPREVQAEAVRLSAPDTGFAALRSQPGGEGVVAAWAHRRSALEAYRAALVDHGTHPASVLPSLLHMHYNRAAGIDPDGEAICRRLARTAALSWTARDDGAPQ